MWQEHLHPDSQGNGASSSLLFREKWIIKIFDDYGKDNGKVSRCRSELRPAQQKRKTIPELQPKDPKEWMWEAPDKKSVYLMRKQAEKEYHAVEVIAHGKHGDYITHKSLPKNSEPVKEAVVRVKRDTTVADVKRWTDLMEQKYGIRAVGIYLHMDEGHWATLKEGQTEDMYRRTDGKEWKRLNEFGEWEHESIDLWPLNRAYNTIHVDAEDSDSFRIIGEFIEVVDIEK